MIVTIRLLALVGLTVAAPSCSDGLPSHEAGLTRTASDSASITKVRLGARLFQDTTLSLDSTISCATCHMPTRAFTEPHALSHGIGVDARKRNAPSLVNVSVFHSTFDWDGRAKSLEDQLRGVFAIAGDMGIDLSEAVARIRNSPAYDTAFRQAYGRPSDIDAVLAALAAFQRTLVVGESRFDRFYLGGDSTSLSESERRGWRLFRRSECAGCHVPLPDPGGSGIIIFSDNGFHNLGVGYKDGRMEDVGRYTVTHNSSHWGAFRTPSLRNVGLTAPYMHDGSIATLEDVITFYSNGGIRNPNIDPVMEPLKFTRQEEKDLVAFLLSLTTDWLTDSGTVSKRLLRIDGDTVMHSAH